MYLTEQNKFSIFTDQTNVFAVKLMTIMKDIKQGDSWKVGNELPLFEGVCKFQKWVENENRTWLKPIIWYISWYFSRGGWLKRF